MAHRVPRSGAPRVTHKRDGRPLAARRAYVRRAKTVDDNLLNTLANGASSSAGVRVVAYLFAWFIIGLGIPIFCVIARYNLQASRWSMRRALHPHHDRQAGGAVAARTAASCVVAAPSSVSRVRVIVRSPRSPWSTARARRMSSLLDRAMRRAPLSSVSRCAACRRHSLFSVVEVLRRTPSWTPSPCSSSCLSSLARL